MATHNYLGQDEEAIAQIKKLIESGQKENVALALQLIKGGGMVTALVTHLCAILLIYHDDTDIKEATIALYKFPLAFRFFYGGVVYNDDIVNRIPAIADDHPDIDTSLLAILLFEQTGKLAAYCLENQLLPVEHIIAKKLTGNYLSLSRMNLSFLPPEVGLFTQIEHLNIVGNQFSSIPDELKNLTKLTHIYIDDTPLDAQAIAKLELFFPKAMAEYYAQKSNTIMNTADRVWNEYERALQYIEKALSLAPNTHNYYLEKGLILRTRRDHKQAIEVLEQALALSKAVGANPALEQKIYNDQGISYIRLGKYTHAHQVYHQALQLNPQYGTAWYNQACAYALEQNKEQTLHCLQQAIHLRGSFKTEAKRDSDFQSFYQDPDFIALVGK